MLSHHCTHRLFLLDSSLIPKPKPTNGGRCRNESGSGGGGGTHNNFKMHQPIFQTPNLTQRQALIILRLLNFSLVKVCDKLVLGYMWK